VNFISNDLSVSHSRMKEVVTIVIYTETPISNIEVNKPTYMCYQQKRDVIIKNIILSLN
jgi:hypothetical protein